MSTPIGWAWSILGALLRNRSGGFMSFMAFAMMPLLGAIGASVDLARMYMIKARLSQAVDAAALAGGRAMFNATRDTDVRMFFSANFPNGLLGATPSAPTIAVNAAQTQITVSADATLPMSFFQLFGYASTTVSATGTATRDASGLEIALVLDVTGSMAQNNNIRRLRDAASDLVRILYGTRDQIPDLYLGIVPYVATVNIGPSRANWTDAVSTYSAPVAQLTRSNHTVRVTTVAPHGFSSGDIIDIAGASQSEYNGRHYIMITSPVEFTYRISRTLAPASPASGTITATRQATWPAGTPWKGCVEARPEPYETTDADAPPGVRRFRQFFWQSTANMQFVANNGDVMADANGRPIGGDNNWPTVNQVPDNVNARGPNLACGNEVLPLQNRRDDALNYISGLRTWPRGGTHGNVGLAWGWRMLSPNYRGLWGGGTPSDRPRDYGVANHDKILVFMTDGQNDYADLTVWPESPTATVGLPGCAGLSPCHMEADTDYTAYGRLTGARLGTANRNQAILEMNRRTATLCSQIRARGVTIYTIVLEVNDPATQRVYSDCAGPGRYFVAPSGNQLRAIFQQIAVQISNLRLTR